MAFLFSINDEKLTRNHMFQELKNIFRITFSIYMGRSEWLNSIASCPGKSAKENIHTPDSDGGSSGVVFYD